MSGRKCGYCGGTGKVEVSVASSWAGPDTEIRDCAQCKRLANPPAPAASVEKAAEEWKVKELVWSRYSDQERKCGVLGFLAGHAHAAAEVAKLRKRIEELEARKCSHGDYRMIGTDDCKDVYNDCGGRTEIYVIGEGLCISCRNKREHPQ